MYLNLRGIVLESDNAVTMPDGKKYDGVKKIFKISDRHPAGIMINGNMEFEKIPIENLIEEFRQNTDFKELKTIDDIKNALIDSLKENTSKSTLEEYLTPLLDDFKFNLVNDIHNNGFKNALSSKKRSPIKEYIKNYSNYTDEFFELIPPDEDEEKYNETLWEMFSYELDYEGTGIIIAGYNLKSNKPSFVEINVHCNDNGNIIYDEIDNAIDSTESKLKIFAINNEGYAYITGVNEEFVEYVLQYIKRRNKNMINNISEDLKVNNIDNCDEILEIIKNELNEEYSSLESDIEEYRLDAINDTTKSIEYLPRRLICEFLDTINQLTVIKQQTSSEIETVSKGSHICLITKSHGFQWIKFDKEIL